MTITISSNFETMTIVSDYFTSDYPTGTFYWTLNCEDDENDFVIDDLLSTVEDGTIQISASDLYPSRTTFPDGVYSIRVQFEGTDTQLIDDVETLLEGTHEETACIFIGTTTNCKAYKKFEETEDTVLEYLLKALQILNDCDCDCSNACTIYEALLDRIQTSKSSTNDNTDCGCS